MLPLAPLKRMSSMRIPFDVWVKGARSPPKRTRMAPNAAKTLDDSMESSPDAAGRTLFASVRFLGAQPTSEVSALPTGAWRRWLASKAAPRKRSSNRRRSRGKASPRQAI